MNIRVLIVDDNPLFRRMERSMLEGHQQIEICAEADNGEDAVTKARSLRPDVILMDISMPRMNGIEATRQIVSEFPQTKIIIISQYDTAIVSRYASVYASAFLNKSDLDGNLISTITRLVN